ncbi:hypothetical protein INT46_009812 [Mucor plumbeus]|uniref:Uncharacterized protein n=1 Tax=Mucor plumbeus TaxID=97098 RepID=A0A8H7URM6_9FUNG|nr:hypothetical protein INT46_009812 [Mucor plumbeus]
MLYALFCSTKCKQRIFVLNFKGNSIKQDLALADKDAVFIQDGDDTLNALSNRRPVLETLFKERRKELDQFILTAKSVNPSERDWKIKVAVRDKYYCKTFNHYNGLIYEYQNPSILLTLTTSPNPFVFNGKSCHKKAEECILDTDVNLDNIVFKTAETVYFVVNQFTFHLELYNQFQTLGLLTLENSMDTDDTYNLECMKLPLSLIIDLKEINQEKVNNRRACGLGQKKRNYHIAAYIIVKQSKSYKKQFFITAMLATNRARFITAIRSVNRDEY